MQENIKTTSIQDYLNTEKKTSKNKTTWAREIDSEYEEKRPKKKHDGGKNLKDTKIRL